jgi:hypothetical protein
MRLLLANLKALAETVLANAVYTYDKEPARVIALAAALVVFIARTQGIVVDEGAVANVLGEVVAILLAGEGIRSKVSPVR